MTWNKLYLIGGGFAVALAVAIMVQQPLIGGLVALVLFAGLRVRSKPPTYECPKCKQGLCLDDINNVTPLDVVLIVMGSILCTLFLALVTSKGGSL